MNIPSGFETNLKQSGSNELLNVPSEYRLKYIHRGAAYRHSSQYGTVRKNGSCRDSKAFDRSHYFCNILDHRSLPLKQ